MNKLSYKMENDAVVAGSAAAGIGAGLYSLRKHLEAGKAVKANTLRGAALGAAAGAGSGVLESELAIRKMKKVPAQLAALGFDADNIAEIKSRFPSRAATHTHLVPRKAVGGSVIGAGLGYIKGTKQVKALASKRNAGLAIAALLGLTALATKERGTPQRLGRGFQLGGRPRLGTPYCLGLPKVAADSAPDKIDRWNNSNIQAVGGAALGGGIGAIAGGVVGRKIQLEKRSPSKNKLKRFIGNVLLGKDTSRSGRLLDKLNIYGKNKRLIASTLLGGAAVGGLVGGSSGLQSGSTGYIVGSGVNRDSDTSTYAEDQAKRHAILGALTGGVAGNLIGGPRMGLYSAVAGGLGGALLPAATGAIGHKIRGS